MLEQLGITSARRRLRGRRGWFRRIGGNVRLAARGFAQEQQRERQQQARHARPQEPRPPAPAEMQRRRARQVAQRRADRDGDVEDRQRVVAPLGREQVG